MRLYWQNLIEWEEVNNPKVISLNGSWVYINKKGVLFDQVTPFYYVLFNYSDNMYLGNSWNVISKECSNCNAFRDFKSISYLVNYLDLNILI